MDRSSTKIHTHTQKYTHIHKNAQKNIKVHKNTHNIQKYTTHKSTQELTVGTQNDTKYLGTPKKTFLLDKYFKKEF